LIMAPGCGNGTSIRAQEDAIVGGYPWIQARWERGFETLLVRVDPFP